MKRFTGHRERWGDFVDVKINALEVLHSKGIRTFAMIAPILPGAEGLIKELAGKVDHVLVDRLNYH
jgi:DNA repair photolyase